MNDKLEEIIKYAVQFDSDIAHPLHVAHLSKKLFELLTPVIPPLHQRNDLLANAAILHDIGWCGGQNKHHKRSFEMIISNPPDGFSPEEILIIANIARYHRKALPKPQHDGYAKLRQTDRETVCYLASILRIADGLDALHRSIVDIAECRISNRNVELIVIPGNGIDEEIESAIEKSDLFTETFNRKFNISQKELS